MKLEMSNSTRTRRSSSFALAIIGLVFFFASVAQAATFHVTTTADNGDNNNPTPGSLRKAIMDANAHPGVHTIDFNIPGAGVHTISPPQPLPSITGQVVIDGYTQPGASVNTLANGDNAVLLIELDGSNAGTGASGLNLAGIGNTIRGLAINRFSSNGIIATAGAGGNVITGNFIGTDPSGTANAGNSFGISIANSSNNTIGGTTPAARNLISGNIFYGIDILGVLSGTIVWGNLIGTDVTGKVALGNNEGIYSNTPSDKSVTIGGITAASRNVISGNKGDGILLTGTGSGVIVQGNYIGTDVSGNVALGNKDAGIRAIAPGTLIGGAAAGARNIISGNGFPGIYIQSHDTLVFGNSIGYAANGITSLGNGFYGVWIYGPSNNNTIGGPGGSSNSIAFNGLGGVYVQEGSSNTISANSITSNKGLGIELYPYGVTPNDSGDGDSGPNNLQNFPAITSATTSGTVTVIQGTLNSTPVTKFHLEFFANSQPDSTGFGQGETFIGSSDVTTNASGDANFNVGFSLIPTGKYISATATDPAGNTSEFSLCAKLDAAPPALSISDLSISEGSSGQKNADIAVTLTHPYSLPVTVDFATVDDAAMAPGDYTAKNGTLTFAPGQTSQNITVSINGDTQFEPDETFFINLANPANAIFNKSHSTVTILNDDVKPAGTLAFSVSNYSVNESDGMATITVKRTNGSNGAVSVQYFSAAGGTATVGSDYLPPSGTLNWADGDTSDKTFTVSIVDDQTNEPDETLNLTLSNPTLAQLGSPSTAVLTIKDNDPQPQTANIQIEQPNYSVSEGDHYKLINVTRTGDTSTDVSVDYATSDGTAQQRTDYTLMLGRLHFAPGETSKTLTFLVTEDSYVEGDETLMLSLSNPVGATLGGQSQAQITILDNDSNQNAQNAIVDVQNFVRQQYHDFLNREPDPAGFQGWQDVLNNCAPGNTTCDRIEVSSAFYRSQEFHDRGYFIYRFYSAALGRTPQYLEFMRDMQKVSGFLSAQQQEQAKVDFIAEFLARSEFQQKYGQVTDPGAYVDALSATAGVNLSTRNQIVSQLQGNQITRGQALRAVVESAEVDQHFYNQGFVVMQYFGYLRRDPDILYQQWIQTLNQTNDYRILVNGFMNSLEYVLRFGQ